MSLGPLRWAPVRPCRLRSAAEAEREGGCLERLLRNGLHHAGQNLRWSDPAFKLRDSDEGAQRGAGLVLCHGTPIPLSRIRTMPSRASKTRPIRTQNG